MKKEIIIDKYNIVTNKVALEKAKKFRIISDLHIGIRTITNKGNKIIQPLEKYFQDQSEIDAILIPGDLVNGARSFNNLEYMRQLRSLLASLGEVAPTIISKGNHDLWLENSETAKNYKTLETVKNVFPLDNEQIEIDGVVYTGFSPRHTAYSVFQQGKKANQMFIEDWQNSELEFEKDKLNILLNHAPHLIANPQALKELREIYQSVTLIASGHLHNGVIPDVIEQKFTRWLKDRGVWPSTKTAFVNDMCRGGYALGLKKTLVALPKEEQEMLIELLDYEAALVVSKGANRVIDPPSVTEVSIQNSEPIMLTKKLK